MAIIKKFRIKSFKNEKPILKLDKVSLSFGNRNYLKGVNLIGLRRKKYDNKKIIELDQAYKKIFSSNNLHENLSKINGEFKANELVQEVTKFIEKDKKRPICTPLSE